MSSINKKTKRVAYIHEKYRAFVDRPELINDLLELAVKDAKNFLGENVTLQEYINQIKEIENKKEEQIRNRVHSEDLDFIKVIMQNFIPIAKDVKLEKNIKPEKKEQVSEKNNQNQKKVEKNQSEGPNKNESSNNDEIDDSVVNDTVKNFLKKIQH